MVRIDCKSFNKKNFYPWIRQNVTRSSNTQALKETEDRQSSIMPGTEGEEQVRRNIRSSRGWGKVSKRLSISIDQLVVAGTFHYWEDHILREFWGCITIK